MNRRRFLSFLSLAPVIVATTPLLSATAAPAWTTQPFVAAGGVVYVPRKNAMSMHCYGVPWGDRPMKIRAGLMTANEARAEVGLPPLKS